MKTVTIPDFVYEELRSMDREQHDAAFVIDILIEIAKNNKELAESHGLYLEGG